MTDPMAKVWERLILSDSSFAGLLVLLLYLGPPAGLAIVGGQMAKHGLPI